MVSQGYWLRAPGRAWTRVRLEDYLTAAGNSGLFTQPEFDLVGPPQNFVDIETGMRGTTIDPNLEPDPGPPPPLTHQQVEEAAAIVYQMIEFMADRLLTLGRHLEQIAQVYHPTKAGDGSRA